MNTTMMLLGVVKLRHPVTNETTLVEVKGFDVLGLFFPFIRLLVNGLWGKLALFCVTFYLYPIWAWYVGFNSKRMKFEKMIANGWVVDEDEKPKAVAA